MTKIDGLTKDEYTIAEHQFKTADGLHKIYVHEWGNPKGKPILFLHGGPGGSCNDKHKDTYDPDKYRVVFFDQRGSGQSEPKGLLKNNTTQHLIEDIELIRKRLKLDKFSLHGRSWGSALALAYAVDYPGNVNDMVVGGIFMATDEECQWFDGIGYKIFFPEIWETITEGVPKKYLNNPGEYHRKQILEKNSKKSAYLYAEAESAILSLDDRYKLSDYEDYDTNYARIIAHYISNNCFLKEKYILNNASKLKMPVYILHGRYDMVCLPHAAYKLHQALPNSKLYWTLAGHKASDRSTHDVTRTLLDLIY